MKPSKPWRRLLAATSILLLCASVAGAQSQSGSLYGTVTDNSGTPLPGVTVNVEISGGGAEQIQVTGARGEFRFLGMAPALYTLRAALDSFSAVEHTNVQINIGRNTSIDIKLTPAVEETITVTSETPILDSRKVSISSTVSQTELEKIPSARDPWAVLQTVPGVQTDRINVGGNESGQQSQFTGPGAAGSEAVWAVDGVVITDMSATGSSPVYYNFDAFEEMQVATGGSDASKSTSGVALNMVTKRGTNEWRGSGRYIQGDEGLQSGLEISESEFGVDFDGDGPTTDQSAFSQGNRMVTLKDFGFEIGGPLMRDKVWIWANYGKNEVDLLTVNDFSDTSDLENYGSKVNAQLSTSNSLVGFYNYANKGKVGRNAGPTRPQPTTWIQDGPSDIYKIEDTHVFSSSFFLTGMASYVDSLFVLTPQAGLDGPQPRWDQDFVWQENFLHHDTDRPQEQTNLDGNYFFNTGEISHDIKFGVGYRHVDLESGFIYPGNGLRLDAFQSLGFQYPVFAAARNTNISAESSYTSAFAQDTLTTGNLTINAGLRFDRQDGRVHPTQLRGVSGFETLPDGSPLLPDAVAAGFEQPFTWEDITPRLGLTYALGEQRKTLLRASFSRFAQQLGQNFTTYDAAGGQTSYAYFYYDDSDGDGFVTPEETFGFLGTSGHDPLAGDTPNIVDPNFEAQLTDELTLGIEHAIRPELVVGVTLTMRNIHNMVEQERLVVDENGNVRAHQHGDYVLNETPVTLPDGSTFDAPVWGLRSGLADNGGFLLTNGDREQDYRGVSFSLNKRLSNRWMMRGNFTLQDWEWDIPQSELEDPNIYLGGLGDDGGPVLQGSGAGSGPKGGVYINAGWSYSLTGMYQVAPQKNWGFNVSAALNGREGYPIPYYVTASVFATGLSTFQATENADDYQHDDIHVVDLRVEKEISLSNFNFTIGAELFNALNESTVLQRQHQLGSGISNHVLEVVSPRLWRFGVRFRFD